MNRVRKLFCVFSLLALLLLTLTTSASAFDGRSGENVIIESDEVIDDDLYITAGTFVMGTPFFYFERIKSSPIFVFATASIFPSISVPVTM